MYRTIPSLVVASLLTDTWLEVSLHNSCIWRISFASGHLVVPSFSAYEPFSLDGMVP